MAYLTVLCPKWLQAQLRRHVVCLVEYFHSQIIITVTWEN